MGIRTWLKSVWWRTEPSKNLGDVGEAMAAKHLKASGFKLIERNYRSRIGEIDIVARDGDCLVFVEVKTRKSVDHGEPFESVGAQKQKKLTQLAWSYAKRHRCLNTPIRFDVISIVMNSDEDTRSSSPEIRHFKAAFEAVEL